jgi:hypothetical protein
MYCDERAKFSSRNMACPHAEQKMHAALRRSRTAWVKGLRCRAKSHSKRATSWLLRTMQQRGDAW